MGNGGTGGFGRGNAPPPESAPGETGSKPTKLSAAGRHKGKIVGSFLKEGKAPKGEAKLELQEFISSGSRLAEESLERERLPAELKEIPRQYFERISGQ